MLFNSLEFLIFFPVVVTLYFACPYRFRWALLLAASYYFYAAWKPEYLFIIIASTLVDYTVAIQMAKRPERSQRTKFLVMSLFTNLGVLFAFKYFNFFNDSMRAAFTSFNIFYDVPAFQVLLPVGISFYTFQTLSYTIDVYRGKLEPERHLGIFALFVSFFPQLVAGPIERAANMLPQFHRTFDFDADRVSDGLRLILWGMFKKVVIADRLGIYVNEVYNNPTAWEGWPVILATYFFAFQIYCDFSGYSDIAIGAAKVMGYDLMENFRRPYLSKSPAEFWRRWHISLSTWFRDYLYIPLGGSRVSIPRWYINLMIVFLVSGLWHGAAWTFVLWGGLHGAYLVLEVATKAWRSRLAEMFQLKEAPRMQAILSGLVTFNLVCFAWIFFRANSISDAFLIVNNLTPLGTLSTAVDPWTGYVLDPPLQMALSLGLIALLMVVHVIQEQGLKAPVIVGRPVVRWGAYLILVLAVMNLGVTEEVPFIYFQF